MDWFENNLGASEYAVFANKCWPAFQTQFKFVPCYVNSRLASKGIPVACETDIYGALSKYIITCATNLPATLLDINNSVPRDMYDNNIKKFEGYQPDNLFMGFHSGNTPKSCMKNTAMKYQLIMHRAFLTDKDSGHLPRNPRRGYPTGRYYLISLTKHRGQHISQLCSPR